MNKEIFKTVTASGIVLIVAAFIILRYEGFFAVIGFIMNVLRPVIMGIIIAFVINRPLYRIDMLYKKFYTKRGWRTSEKPVKTAVLTVYILTLLILGGIIGIVFPQLINNITSLINNFDDYYNNFEVLIKTVSDYLQVEWLKKLDIMGQITKLAEYIPDIVKKTFSVTANIVDGTVDFVIGMVLSVYIISDKANLKRQTDRLLKKILKENIYKKTVYYLHAGKVSFSNFISGQLTEAFILGFLCFIGMNIFRFEYSLMISVIIGITNIIPIAGPILGTIPCAFILLLADPMEAVWFVIFIIVLQQIESNLIYPKVVGNSVGLPPMWVLIAVTVGGGLYGIIGMVVGIPLMSVIYGMVHEQDDAV